MSPIRTAVIVAGLFLLPGAGLAQEPERHAHATHAGVMPLLDGLGTWRHAITTTSPDAQRYFDQGLRLTYAFNHDEALRSFERAAELDPACAMCRWGMAYALGPNINLPMGADAEVAALAAIRDALRIADGATPRERAYIEAMSRRFGEPAGKARAARDSAYADAMREVARRFPDDADAQVLYADALLNLRPWNQWKRDGSPQPGTLDVIATLERSMKLAPDHAGACHFYVHAVEASLQPERALPCAERLPDLMPGAGHVVHMPAHVYLRVGRYEDAARANIAAVEADHRYFESRDVPAGIYPMFYHPHNLHFLWAAYLISGQKTKALGAARALTERVSVEDASQEASLQAFLTPTVLTHARFEDWNAVLGEPEPEPSLPYVRAMWHYARGMAYAGKSDLPAARAELTRLREIAAEVPAETIIILNPARSIFAVAERMLDGSIAAAAGETDRAVDILEEAVRLEEELTYDEPPPWHHPVRQHLGNVLVRAGRHEQAIDVFRQDLRWVPKNGWSLKGLEVALRRLGRNAEAAAVARQFAEAWQHADVGPPDVAKPR